MTNTKKISFFKPNEFLAADNEIFGMELKNLKHEYRHLQNHFSPQAVQQLL
jgi:hypothetical protein